MAASMRMPAASSQWWRKMWNAHVQRISGEARNVKRAVSLSSLSLLHASTDQK